MRNIKTYGTIYHTADLHFDSVDIMKSAGRPFSSVEEMNEAIVTNINARCGSNDTLIIAGDVGVRGKNPVPWLKRMNCHKVLIIGNHDRSMLRAMNKHEQAEFKSCFDVIHSELYLTDGGQDLYISHYPIAEWDGYYKGRWMFYGHVHQQTQGPALLMQFIPTSVNVGVDVNGYMPKTTAELIEERKNSYQVPEVTEPLLRSIVYPEVADRGRKKLDLSDFQR